MSHKNLSNYFGPTWKFQAQLDHIFSVALATWNVNDRFKRLGLGYEQHHAVYKVAIPKDGSLNTAAMSSAGCRGTQTPYSVKVILAIALKTE